MERCNRLWIFYMAWRLGLRRLCKTKALSFMWTLFPIVSTEMQRLSCLPDDCKSFLCPMALWLARFLAEDFIENRNNSMMFAHWRAMYRKMFISLILVLMILCASFANSSLSRLELIQRIKLFWISAKLRLIFQFGLNIFVWHITDTKKDILFHFIFKLGINIFFRNTINTSKHVHYSFRICGEFLIFHGFLLSFVFFLILLDDFELCNCPRSFDVVVL